MFVEARREWESETDANEKKRAMRGGREVWIELFFVQKQWV